MPNPVSRHIEPLLQGLVADLYDANTVTLKLTFSSTEAVGKAEFGIGQILFTPSGVDIHHQAISLDTGTALLTLAPAGTDIGPAFEDAATISLKFTFSAVEIPPPIIYTDAGAIYLDFDFGADDCHAILTPHWDIYISKRWQLDPPVERWVLTAVSKRWSVWIIGVAIDNPCPVPTFEAVF